MGVELGAQAARSRALAVLRIRSRAMAVALLPAAVAVVLFAGGATGHITGGVWPVTRWVVAVVAAVVLFCAVGIALVVARARPATSPTVPIAEESAPDLYRMVRDLADRLDVPAPSAIALTPDCDSWLEDRTHRSHGPPPSPEGMGRAEGLSGISGGIRSGVSGATTPGRRGEPTAPVLVIGSPFLWWMRVGELRAVLAPVIAGTGPSAHPDIAAARRFVRGLDAAVAVTTAPTHGPLARTTLAGVGWVARLLLRGCRGHAAEMERGVAAAAAERAQAVDYGLRIVAQEQVGLAYAGWDRLLTRVALPAWRMGRWPSRLDAGVVAALTELSRRDRLAEGFASRLGERPACDLLEEPGAVDEAASLLAARLFHGGPAESGPDWAPVDWREYPDEVVDRKWRTDAARLHRVLDSLGVRHMADTENTGDTANTGEPEPGGPTLARVLDHLTVRGPTVRGETVWGAEPGPRPRLGDEGEGETLAGHGRADGDRPVRGAGGERETAGRESAGDPGTAGAEPSATPEATTSEATTPEATTWEATTWEATTVRAATAKPGNPGAEWVAENPGAESAAESASDDARPVVPHGAESADADLGEELGLGSERAAALAAGLSAEVAREEASAGTTTVPGGTAEPQGPDLALWDDMPPFFPLQPPRTGRELLTDHVTAMVCCAAMDTAGAAPGLDWLDGPSLLINGKRAVGLAPRVLTLVEDGDPEPLRDWLRHLGVRPEKPVRLV
ncbi:hypothetical protein [Streptomyces bluensis]|uniref:hypothetical protein n=1 Tax=Streptomyces bluensis TaxID=33897 RepID=UPI0016770D43|nr:hypothetical protein [Streptomyces bluensis]